MPKLTQSQLHDWYEKFSQVMKKDVHIDVNCKEDLARVMNFKVLSWDLGSPVPQIDAHYAFMTGDGSNYDKPAPETRQGKYQWTISNQDPNMTDDRIQQLYDMVTQGSLMVRGPRSGLREFQQVRMDGDGRIFLSPKLDEFVDFDDPSNVPPDRRLPKDPEHVPLAPKMAKPVKPELPPVPDNMEPGFFSRLGYYLGLDTDYAKLVRYQAAVEAMPDNMAAYERSMEAYRQNQVLVANRQRYEEELAFTYGHPDVRFHAFMTAYTGNFMSEEGDTVITEEKTLSDYINRKHYDTPLGKLDMFIDENTQRSQIQAPEVLKAHMGKNFYAYPLWTEQGVYNNFKSAPPQPYDLPANPTNPNATDLKELAQLACFAALADPAISGKDPFPKFTQEETTQLRYTHILNDVFTYGRKNSAAYLAYLEPAREKGIQALNDYANGNVQPLADLLAQSLRQTNREAASVSGTSHHAMNTLYYSAQLFKTLEAHPDLMEAAKLTPDEMAESRANSKYLDLMQKSLTSKVAIMEHAIGEKPMTDAQLKEAIVDVLFAAVVDNSVKAEMEDWTNTRANDPKYQELGEKNKASAGTMQLEVDLIQAQVANDPKAAEIEKQLTQLKAESEEVSRRLNLWDFQRPANQMREQLLDEAWVAQSRQALAQSPVMNEIMSMEPSKLLTVLHSNESMVSTFGKELLSQAIKAPAISDPILNNQPSNEFQQPENEIVNFM